MALITSAKPAITSQFIILFPGGTLYSQEHNMCIWRMLALLDIQAYWFLANSYFLCGSFRPEADIQKYGLSPLFLF